MVEERNSTKLLKESMKGRTPTGPAALAYPHPPKPLKPTFSTFIEKWASAATPHAEAAEQFGTEAEALFAEYEEAQWSPRYLKDRPERVTELMPDWLKRFERAIASTSPAINVSKFFHNRKTAEILEVANQLVDQKAKEEYFAEFYSIIPISLQTGLIDSFEDVMDLYPVGDNFNSQDIEKLRSDFVSMQEGIAGEGFSPEDMASIEGVSLDEAKDLYPELVAPTSIPKKGRPITLHQLSSKEILKGLTAAKTPETNWSEEQWNDFLKNQLGYSDVEVDNELVIEAQNLAYAISENAEIRDSFRAGLHQLPEYGMAEFLREMAVSPGIALLEVASIYFEHVSMPIAGKLWKNFFPSLDDSINAYIEANPDASNREAYSYGWDNWDFALPGEEHVWLGSKLSWAVKYMLFEGIADPTTYVGFGLFGRVGKAIAKLSKFGRAGKMLSRSSRAFAAVNTVEMGALQVMELPFDTVKALARRVPKTPALRAALQERISIKVLNKYYTNVSDKTLRTMTPKEFKEITEKLISYKLNNKGLDNDVTRAAEQLLLHGPFDEKDVSRLMTVSGSTINPTDITKATVNNIDEIFEDLFTKGMIDEGLATSRILTTLSGINNEANVKGIKKFLSNRVNQIKKKAMSPTVADTPRHGIMNLAKKNYTIHTKMEKSAAALKRKELGTFSTMLFDIPQKVTHVWTNYIDRFFVMPMAQTYLVFTAYGPFNVLEDVWRTVLGGQRPGRVTRDVMEDFGQGLSYNPDYLRPGVSEMLGYRGVDPNNSLVHYLVGFGKKSWGAKVYKYMVGLPGGISMDLRRNFVLRRNMQIMADLGGDAFKKLESVANRKLPKSVDRKVAKQVRELVRINSIANNPDAIRRATKQFTRAEIALREYDNLLKEFPGISNSARYGLLQDFHNHLTFADVVDIKPVRGVKIATTAFGSTTAGEGAGTMYSLSRVAGEAGEEISLDFANVYRVSASRANKYPNRPVESLAKEWFPERDFLDEATRLGVSEDLVMNRAVGEEAARRGYDAIKYGNKQIQSLKGVTPMSPHDSIDSSFQRRIDEVIDRYVKGPEAMTQQSHALVDELMKLEVQKPEEMARAIEGLYHLSTIYGTTPQQMIAEATVRSRGYNIGMRTKVFDESFERISKFLDDVGVDIDTLVNKIRTTTNASRTISKVDWNRVTIGQGIKDANLDRLIMDTIDDMPINVKLNIKEVRMARASDEMLMGSLAMYLPETGSIVIRSPAELSAHNIRHEIGHSIIIDSTNKRGGAGLRTLGEYQDAIGTRKLSLENMGHWRELYDQGYVKTDFLSSYLLLGDLPRPDHPEMIRAFKRIIKENNEQNEQRLIRFLEPEKLNMSRISNFYYYELNDQFAEDFASHIGREAMSEQALLDSGTTPEALKWFESAYPKSQRALGLSIAQKRATNDTLDLLTSIKEKAYEFRNLNNQTRADFFEGVDATTRRSDEFWGSFRDLMTEQVSAFDTEIADISGRLFKSILELNYAAGERRIARAPIIVRGRKLAPQDVAQLLGVRGDDISRSMLDTLTVQNNKNMFISYVQALRQPGDIGFTKQAIGQVYDQMVNSMRIKANRMSWATKELQELDAARREAHSLYNSKAYSAEQTADIQRYMNDSADIIENTVYETAETRAKAKVLRGEYANYNELRQQAMDEAEKWYLKEFPDYTNANMFDSMMKAIYPYWTYESQRWFWLPRSFIRHPGTFTSFERWQDNTDRGYVHIPGTSIDVGFGRGTIYGTLQTQLAKRDFPEYADSLKAAGGMIEFNDYLSRFGFYPGAHISVPLLVFGGAEPQLGEALPAAFRTPLSAAISQFPESETLKYFSERIFSDRFRDYMTILEVNARDGNGSLIWSKIKEDKPLTEEEQALWDGARGEAALYSVGFEQMGLFRFRTDEFYAAAEEATTVIEEMTGITPEQQLWYRRHNIRLWDTIGGATLAETEILKELDMWSKHAGSITPLLPGRQQEELRHIEMDWDDITRYVEGIDKKEIEYGEEFLAGNLGADAYVSRIKDLAADQRAYIDQKMKENPNLTLEGRKEFMKKYNQVAPVMHPSRELMNMYFAVELREKHDEETGELIHDWDRFWAERQAIEDAVPENYRAEWDAFLSKNLSPVEVWRRKTNEAYIRKYNDIWEVALDQFTPEEQSMIKEYLFLENTGAQLDRQAEIKSTKSSYEGRLLISAFRSSVSSERKALRFANPYLDAWLFYWGRTTTFTTPQAEQTYRLLAKETGRQI